MLKVTCKVDQVTVDNSVYKADKIQVLWKTAHQAFETPLFKLSQYPVKKGQTTIKQAVMFEVADTFYIDPSRDLYLPKMCLFQSRNDQGCFEEHQFDLSRCIPSSDNFGNSAVN